MPQPRLRPEVMREAYEAVARCGSVRGAAEELKLPAPTVQNRYERAVAHFGLPRLYAPPAKPAVAYDPATHPRCQLTTEIEAPDAVVVLWSDAHWTTLDQPRSLAHEALLQALPSISPTHLIALGDMLDFGQSSRHPPISWAAAPGVATELEAGKRHMSDIAALAPQARRVWVRGNHDDRFDRFLAANASMFAGVEGLALADHFQDWPMCWRVNFNDAVFLHANHNGIHAAWNDTLKGGLTAVSGHNHALEVKPLTDYRGRRYGIKTGMLGDPVWPCFNYALGNVRMWGPGWVVLTWQDGQMLPPELCEVVHGRAMFRGQSLAGKPRYRIKAGRAAA
jgi:hypothetical protein